MSKNKEREYKFTDGKFIFVRKDGEERLVATLNETGQVEYELGCKGAHGKTLEEWITKNKISFVNADTPPEKELDDKPSAELKTSTQKNPTKNLEVNNVLMNIEDIPDELLPSFDKRLGASTPEFVTFAKSKKLNEQQITALVRRLEKK